MADDLRGRLEILKDIEIAQKRLERIEQSQNMLIEEKIKATVRQKQEIKKLANELKQANLERIKGFAAEESSLKSMGSIYSDLVKMDRQRILAQVKSEGLTFEQEAVLTRVAEINRELAQLGREDTLQQAALLAEYDMQKSVLASISDENQHLVQNLHQQNELAKIQSQLTNKQKEFLQKQLDVYEGIKDTIGGVLETAELLLSTTGGMFGALAIGAGFFAEKLGEVRSQLGGISEFGTTTLSFIDSNAVDNVKELSNQFGGINNVSTELQASTSLISVNMGISGTEAASLLGSFSRLNGNSEETALNLVKSSQEFAKQNGIIPSQLMADIAGSAEEFALYGKDGGRNLIEAAGAARKMGIELKTMTGIADNLLDFESSITKELELGALLGKNINLDRARSLAYQGEIEAATQETLRALGGVDAFNKMDYFQKKATADLLGTSVAELSKMVNQQEEAAEISKTITGQFSLMGESLDAGLNKYLGTTLKGLGGMLIMIGQMGTGLKTVTDVGKGALDTLKSLGSKIFKKTAESVADRSMDTITENVQNSDSLSDKVNKKGGGIKGILKGFGSGMKGIASGLASFANPATLLGLAAVTAAIIGIGFALKVAAPGIQAFGEAVGSIVRAVGDAVSTVIGGLGDFFMKVSSIATPELVLSIIGLAGGFAALTASLSAFSIVGLAAVPAMMAVGAFATLASGVDSLFGNDTTQPTNENDTMKMLLDEIRGLRTDLNNGKVAVYMDGAKVTASVSKVVNRQATNQYI